MKRKLKYVNNAFLGVTEAEVVAGALVPEEAQEEGLTEIKNQQLE